MMVPLYTYPMKNNCENECSAAFILCNQQAFDIFEHVYCLKVDKKCKIGCMVQRISIAKVKKMAVKRVIKEKLVKRKTRRIKVEDRTTKGHVVIGSEMKPLVVQI